MKIMMKSFLGGLLLPAVLIIGPALPAIAAERSFGTPQMKLVKETQMNDRKVLRYEHESVPQWGYATPQTDYFYLLPLPGNPEGKPLHIVLHSAGHTGDKVLADAFKHPDWFHYAGLEDQIVIYLDCSRNSGDWWWGAHEMYRGKGKFKEEYTPTEKRVLTTIEWAIETYKADRNRIYLSGISMGGSGSLGIGMCRGDIFAAINVAVPAGVDHMKARMFDREVPDPPILVNFSAWNDSWCKGQEDLIAECKAKRYALVFAWGPYEHRSTVAPYHPAALAFPWRSIRKNEAYPVFSNVSTDNVFPGFSNAIPGDASGQIGALFRWKTVTDTTNKFEMQLQLVTQSELKATLAIPGSVQTNVTLEIPTTAQTDVTLRRLQSFRVQSGTIYRWNLSRDGNVVQGGKAAVDQAGLLTLGRLTLIDQAATLCVQP
jgi:hypothetical protein